jgi:hypothetical protein
VVSSPPSWLPPAGKKTRERRELGRALLAAAVGGR